jgi:hypothetical protein
MVKFLEEITVTENESNNFYHYHDNRVMPPHVDEELAKKEGEAAIMGCLLHSAQQTHQHVTDQPVAFPVTVVKAAQVRPTWYQLHLLAPRPIFCFAIVVDTSSSSSSSEYSAEGLLHLLPGLAPACCTTSNE